jgi:hypothetical protein
MEAFAAYRLRQMKKRGVEEEVLTQRRGGAEEE